MALGLKFSTTARNAMLDALRTEIDAGAGAAILAIYSGTKPATPATALSGNTLLAQLTLTDPAATGASSGVLTLSAITQDSSADNTGTATWFRIYKSADGTTISDPTNAVVDGTVGTSGCDLNLTSTAIVATEPVSISSFTITAGNA